MSNVLKVSHQEAIRSLHQKGWSQRRIARELGIHRRTVRRYVEEESKCTSISTPGSSDESSAKCTGISTPGSEGVLGGAPAVLTADHWGRKSRCEPFEAAIDSKMKAGLSAQRIYQDLIEEKAFLGSYQSVKRFVRRLKAGQPERVWRLECQPGEEMQVDFCLGAPIEGDDGKTRRSWVLRAVLSYSRKGYSEAVMRQDTESFLRCLENALRHFGGVPLLLNLDNFKAAVLKADWFDPEINPKLAEFCRHYHLHVMPCRPQMPQHKGKVERAVSYVRGNALKGRRFRSLAEENAFLSRWEETVADKRIHGTTCKQVAARFAEERPPSAAAASLALSLLPGSPTQRKSRQFCGGPASLLRSASGVYRPTSVGALGQSLRAYFQRPPRAGANPPPLGARQVQPPAGRRRHERSGALLLPMVDRTRGAAR